MSWTLPGTPGHPTPLTWLDDQPRHRYFLALSEDRAFGSKVLTIIIEMTGNMVSATALPMQTGSGRPPFPVIRARMHLRCAQVLFWSALK